MDIIDMQILKAINNVSKRLNEVECKLESFLLDKHEENKEAINISDGGIVDIAEILSIHDEAIAELAEMIAAREE